MLQYQSSVYDTLGNFNRTENISSCVITVLEK